MSTRAGELHQLFTEAFLGCDHVVEAKEMDGLMPRQHRIFA
jgi:hypothetical protein